MITYLTPARPQQLDEAIRGALEGGKVDRGKPRSQMLWWIALGLTLGAAVSAIGMLSWRRAARSVPDV